MLGHRGAEGLGSSDRTTFEGSALWGLSMALHEGTAFANGQVKDTKFDADIPMPIGDVPNLDIEFIDSTDVPVGLGEPGTTVVAPGSGICRSARAPCARPWRKKLIAAAPRPRPLSASWPRLQPWLPEPCG